MRARSLFFLVTTMPLAVGTVAQAATKIDDPEKFVRTVYEHLTKSSGDYREPDDIYTERLAALFALDSKEAGGEVGRLDFDFWTDAQDYQLRDVHVTSEPVEGAPTRRTVTATFKNIGRPERIHFYFERTRLGWKLDDVRSVSKQNWTLSLVLKYGWDDDK